MEHTDAMEESLLHRLLVNTNRMQAIPAVIVLGALLLCALLAGAVWGGRTADTDLALLIGAALLAFALLDWALLYALRATGRSYGPERPSTLALALLRLLLLAVLGLMAPLWWLGLLIMAALSVAVFYATWVEPFRLGVTHETYVTDKWQSDQPLRLLHIGDIHMERSTPRERHLNRLVAELQPDIIVFSGDYVNLSNTHDSETEQAIREVIGQWRAPLGVYCISGTPLVEPLDRVRAFTRNLDNLRLLVNEWATVETPGGPLHILGLSVTHDMDRDRALLAEAMPQAPEGGIRLLLMHPPDIGPEANAAGFDLYLCGHTHGGQIRLPLIGAPFSSSHLGNQFIMGRYELGTTTLYTSRGVGLEGLGAPRARFLCPPEIILWTIRRR